MLTNRELVKAEANILKPEDEGVIDPHLVNAEFECRRQIGNMIYDLIACGSADTREFIILQKAETNFAVSSLLYSLNISTTGSGIMLREETAEGKIKEVMSQGGLKKLTDHYRLTAINFLLLLMDKQIKSFQTEGMLMISPGGRDE